MKRISDKTTEIKNDRDKNSILPWLIGLLLVAIVTLGTYLIFSPKQEEDRNLVMINIVDMTVDEARFALESMGLSLGKITYSTTDDIPKGHIISSYPQENQLIEKGSTVNVNVSDGMYFVVGDYTNMQESEVRSLLSNQTNIRIYVEKGYFASYSPGTVVRQELLLEGDKLDPSRNYEIKLVVADYLQVTIPMDIVGKNVNDARADLEALGVAVLLNPMDASEMSEEELEKVRDIVQRVTPEQGSYYVQEENKYVTLYYY